MEIRAAEKDYKKFLKLNINGLQITKDESLKFSVIMVQTDDGQLVEWSRGTDNITSYLKYGYVRIIKNCPHRIGKCIGEKCSLYIVQNGTGDCAHVWGVYK